jgi:hypothetical protein
MDSDAQKTKNSALNPFTSSYLAAILIGAEGLLDVDPPCIKVETSGFSLLERMVSVHSRASFLPSPVLAVLPKQGKDRRERPAQI